MKNNVAVITSGFLPVPATKGGAVENLVENILNENEKKKRIRFNIFSIYDENAKLSSNKYNKTSFTFIKTPKIVVLFDKCIYFIAKKILKKSNAHSYRFILQRLHYLRKVSIYLKENNYDYILLENHPTQYLALKWKKNYLKYENRFYYHCHNEIPSDFGCTEIIKKTKQFICVSDFIKKTIVNRYKIDQSRVLVLRNGVDQERFRKIDENGIINIKKKYNIAEDEKVLLFTGRIVPEKGVLELIQSIKKVKYAKYKLLIVGSSLNDINNKTPYEERIEREIEDIKDKVIFTGFIKYNQINDYYAAADIAIIPSIWDDPAPLTIIESLNSGLPIITTDSGGIPEYANKKCAIFVKRDKNIVDNLAKSVDSIINDEKKLKSMKYESLQAAEELTIDNYYNDFLKIMGM